jgi:glycosyltransferase involved in cell wall biosynthesis
MKILMTLANPFIHDPRVYMEARSLVKAGHNVTVLAWDRIGDSSPFENKDGIEVVRSYNSKFMNLINYEIFRMQLWWRKGFKDALELHNKKHFDIVHCHDLSSLSIGLRLRKKVGIPIIYDAHEIFGYMIANDVPKFFVNLAFSTEKKWIKNVDHIITISEPLRDFYKSISKKPISVIMNCKPLWGKKYEPPNNKKFTLVYIGSLNNNRYVLELIDVVKEISDVHLIIAGIGKPDFINLLKKRASNVKNVDFIGVIPMDDVLPMTKKSDLVICMSNPDDLNSKRGLANKQFEAMVCGRPIICTKNIHSGDVTEQEKCGLAALFTKKDLKEKIIKLKDNPKLCEELGKNALNAAIRKYNWGKQEEELLKIYEGFMK